MSAALRMLGWRYLAVAIAAGALTAVTIGIPTDVLPNPWFTRMTPVRTTDLVLWPVTSVLVGALLATYLTPAFQGARSARGGVGVGSGTLSWLAIGCPVCNKAVVALLGVSGALRYFGPAQPFIGALAVVLAGGALAVRLRALGRGCPLPARGDATVAARPCSDAP